jgi:hypothetical protein
MTSSAVVACGVGRLARGSAHKVRKALSAARINALRLMKRVYSWLTRIKDIKTSGQAKSWNQRNVTSCMQQTLEVVVFNEKFSKNCHKYKGDSEVVARMQRKAIFFPNILGEARIVWCNTPNLLDWGLAQSFVR